MTQPLQDGTKEDIFAIQLIAALKMKPSDFLTNYKNHGTYIQIIICVTMKLKNPTKASVSWMSWLNCQFLPIC